MSHVYLEPDVARVTVAVPAEEDEGRIATGVVFSAVGYRLSRRST